MVAFSQATSVQVLKNQLADLQAMPVTPDVTAAIATVQSLLAYTQGSFVATGAPTSRPMGDRLAEVVDVKDYGAKGDGVTDDTAAINAAIVAATTVTATTYSSTGGRDVYFPPGIYPITALIVIPQHVNILGSGKALTVFLATNAAASIRFGTDGTNVGSLAERGGLSRGFTLNGNNIATTAMWIVGFTVERTFEDIIVENCINTGCEIDAAQNCNFIGCNSNHNGTNLVLDYGAGNNRGFGWELDTPSIAGLVIRQTAAGPAGSFAVPTGNSFFGSVIERFSGAGFIACISQSAGKNNKFERCDISCTGITYAAALVKLRNPAAVTSNLFFTSCLFSGTAAFTSALDSSDASQAYFMGYNNAETGLNLLKVGDATFTYVQQFTSGGIANQFANNTGGVAAESVLVNCMSSPFVHVLQPNAGGKSGLQVLTVGDTAARLDLRGDGSINLGPGNAVQDVFLSRGTISGVLNLQVWGNGLNLAKAGANAQILFGTGVPAAGSANGSIFLRTDGVGGSTFYVRIAGAWVAVA